MSATSISECSTLQYKILVVKCECWLLVRESGVRQDIATHFADEMTRRCTCKLQRMDGRKEGRRERHGQVENVNRNVKQMNGQQANWQARA